MVETPYYIFCVNILFKCFFYFNKIDSVLFLYLIAYLTMICSMCNKKTGFVGDDWIMAVYVNDVCYCGECSLKKMGASSIDMNGKFVKKKKKNLVFMEEIGFGVVVIKYPKIWRQLVVVIVSKFY